jgi:hypothetical protein
MSFDAVLGSSSSNAASARLRSIRVRLSGLAVEMEQVERVIDHAVWRLFFKSSCRAEKLDADSSIDAISPSRMTLAGQRGRRLPLGICGSVEPGARLQRDRAAAMRAWMR